MLRSDPGHTDHQGKTTATHSFYTILPGNELLRPPIATTMWTWAITQTQLPLLRHLLYSFKHLNPLMLMLQQKNRPAFERDRLLATVSCSLSSRNSKKKSTSLLPKEEASHKHKIAMDGLRHILHKGIPKVPTSKNPVKLLASTQTTSPPESPVPRQRVPR